MIFSWTRHIPLLGFTIAIALYISAMWLMNTQLRSIAFHADALIAIWLGRGHICNGLHALADRSQAPGRKRRGEPSLAERIKRVCGTRVDVKDNELTLVR